MISNPACPDCDPADIDTISRRKFVAAVGAGVVGAGATSFSSVTFAKDKASSPPKPETLTKKLYDTLTPEQKKNICFAWDHVTKDRGLLRTHVSNNWHITDHRKFRVGGDFFTKDQQEIIEAIFFGLYNPEWHSRVRQQLKDDAGGYGRSQSIAIFGDPNKDRFEFVMTGRHLTIRCDGNTTDHVAFGGPIFYGHDPNHVFNEEKDHPNNIYWHQGLKANALFKMLDGKQRKQALVAKAPQESRVGFKGKDSKRAGINVGELSKDQSKHVREVLSLLLEPYRQSDQNEAMTCLKGQGGLDNCNIAFYQSEDIGDDQVWDIWRIEGPSFVWHYRGAPHVHVWVNIADDSAVKLNARG